MSVTQVTVTSTQVAVRYLQNVSSLSIDMSADCQTTTCIRHFNRNIDQVLVEILADISVDMSLNTSTDTSRSIHGMSVSQAMVDMSTDTRLLFRLIYRSRDAQSTHDPTNLQTIPKPMIVCLIDWQTISQSIWPTYCNRWQTDSWTAERLAAWLMSHGINLVSVTVWITSI